jgi:hypothetical protein
LSTNLGEIGFTLQPLTDEKRTELGLPKRTIRYAVVDSPTDPEMGDEALTFWVDEEILARLALSPASPAAKSFQRQLFLDAMQAIVNEAARTPEIRQQSVDELEGSLLGRLIERAAGPRGAQSDEAFTDRKGDVMDFLLNDPEKFAATIEDWVPELKKDLADSLTLGGS